MKSLLRILSSTILHLFPLVLVFLLGLGGCTPTPITRLFLATPTTTPQQATAAGEKDLSEISNIVVDTTEAVEQDGEREALPPLPNCFGTGDLVQTLESRAAVEEQIRIGTNVKTSAGVEVEIPVSAKAQLEAVVGRTYESVFSRETSRTDTIQMRAAPGSQVTYVILWEERVFDSVVSFTGKSGERYEAPYTYLLRVPKLYDSFETPCSINTPTGEEATVEQNTPTLTSTPTPKPTLTIVSPTPTWTLTATPLMTSVLSLTPSTTPLVLTSTPTPNISDDNQAIPIYTPTSTTTPVLPTSTRTLTATSLMTSILSPTPSTTPLVLTSTSIPVVSLPIDEVEQVEAEWPKRMSMDSTDSVRVTLMRTQAGYEPKVEVDGNAIITATVVSIGTPEAFLEDARGPGYQVFAAAELKGSAFDIEPASPQTQPYDTEKLHWIWNISPKRFGRHVLNATIYIQWVHGDTIPITATLNSKAVQRQVWRGRFEVNVSEPVVRMGSYTMGELWQLLFGAGALGALLAYSMPRLYQRVFQSGSIRSSTSVQIGTGRQRKKKTRS